MQGNKPIKCECMCTCVCLCTPGVDKPCMIDAFMNAAHGDAHRMHPSLPATVLQSQSCQRVQLMARLPAARQLSCTQFEELLQAAVKQPKCWTTDKLVKAVLQLPAALQLSAEAVRSLLNTAVQHSSWPAMPAFHTSLVLVQHAQELSSTELWSLLLSAMQKRPIMLRELGQIPFTAEQLTDEATEMLLLQAVKHSPGTLLALCSMEAVTPHVQQLQPEFVEGLLRAVAANLGTDKTEFSISDAFKGIRQLPAAASVSRCVVVSCISAVWQFLKASRAARRAGLVRGRDVHWLITSYDRATAIAELISMETAAAKSGMAAGLQHQQAISELLQGVVLHTHEDDDYFDLTLEMLCKWEAARQLPPAVVEELLSTAVAAAAEDGGVSVQVLGKKSPGAHDIPVAALEKLLSDAIQTPPTRQVGKGSPHPAVEALCKLKPAGDLIPTAVLSLVKAACSKPHKKSVLEPLCALCISSDVDGAEEQQGAQHGANSS